MGQSNGLDLGVVGVGWIGVYHARTLVGLPDVASVTIRGPGSAAGHRGCD